MQTGMYIRDFKILSKIGEGGMGYVFLAEDEMLGRQVALKTLNKQFTTDPQLIERFKTEARAQAGITHPNIVTLYTFFKEQEDYIMVLEYARGKTLRQMLTEKKKFTEDETKDILIQLLDGLGYAHSMGVVHRDIKPGNIIIDETGRLKILDFGIAKILGDRNLTKTGMKLGTINYMSPEQVMADKELDQRTDIYSLGVLIYEMLTGRLPINTNTDSDFVLMKEIVEGEIVNPKNLEGSISDKLSSVLLRMLSKKKEDRHPTCLQVKEDLFDGRLHAIQAKKQSKIIVPKINNVINIDPYNPEMVLVEGGKFLIGSNDGEDDELPIHEVELNSFYIGKYPVTQKEWEAIMGNNPSYFKGSNLPVEKVSWNDAQEFIKLLNGKTGKRYRLPTEAEWEYAAKGGNKSRGFIFSGSNKLDDVGWYRKNSNNKTHEVGQKLPNELGVYDMSGNVWEWCSDWYDKKYYNKSEKINPHGPLELGFFSDNHRVLRGGSWYDNDNNCRSSIRYNNYPGVRYNYFGFRLAQE